MAATFLAISPASNIDKERPGLAWDDDWVEEKGAGGVEATGGAIGWVLRTWDIPRVYRSAAILRKFDETTEDKVCRPVGTTLFPPSLDDPAIVSMEDDVIALL